MTTIEDKRKANLKLQVPLRWSRALRVLKNASAEIDEGLRGQRLDCKKGCNACCKNISAVSYLEATEAIKEAYRIGHDIDRMVLDEQAKSARKKNAWSDEDMRAAHGKYPCVFLGAGGACAVYAARPLACRLHNVRSGAKNCVSYDGPVEKYDTNETAERYYPQLMQAHGDIAVKPTIGPLPVVVKAVLDGVPSSEIAKYEGCCSADDRYDATIERRQQGVML